MAKRRSSKELDETQKELEDKVYRFWSLKDKVTEPVDIVDKDNKLINIGTKPSLTKYIKDATKFPKRGQSTDDYSRKVWHRAKKAMDKDYRSKKEYSWVKVVIAHLFNKGKAYEDDEYDHF